jgi:hypothetical protein
MISILDDYTATWHQGGVQGVPTDPRHGHDMSDEIAPHPVDHDLHMHKSELLLASTLMSGAAATTLFQLLDRTVPPGGFDKSD